MSHQDLLSRLAVPADSKIVLLVVDGVGDLRTDDQSRTALDVAQTPNLDALTERSAVGRLVPVLPGVTPGSGPGHLGLFGYDPADPATEIGRGVLEALGLGSQTPPVEEAREDRSEGMLISGLGRGVKPMSIDSVVEGFKLGLHAP